MCPESDAMSTPSRARRILITLMGQFGRVAIGAVSALVIAAFVGPVSKGVLATLVGLSTIASTLVSLGMNGAATYFLGKGSWKPKEALGVLAASTAWTLVGAAVAWVALSGVPFVASLRNEGLTVAIFALATGAQTLSTVLGGILLGRQDFKSWSIQGVLAPALALGLFAVMRFAGWGSTAIALSSWLGGLYLSCIPGVIVLGRMAAWRISWPQRFAGAVSYGLRSSAATAMSVLNLRLDIVLLGVLGGAAATGQYALAVQFTELLWVVPTAIGYVVFPEVAGSPHHEGAKTAALCREAIVAGIAAAIVVVCAGGIYVALVPQYRPSMIAMALLLPGTIAFTAAKVLGNDLYGRGLPHAHTWAAAASVIPTLFGDLLLIPRYGFIAAASVSSVAYVCYTVVILWWFRRATAIGPVEATVPRGADVRALVLGVRNAIRGVTAWGNMRSPGQGRSELP